MIHRVKFTCGFDTNVIYPIEIHELLFWFAHYELFGMYLFYFHLNDELMLNFDENGYIVPGEPVIVDYKTFVREFVVNDYRADIFSEYKGMLQELSELLVEGFSQWINGSFTTRKPRPNDIDVVTFILLFSNLH